MLRVRPSYGYLHPECQMEPPPGVDSTLPLMFDLQLLQCFSDAEVRPSACSQGARWQAQLRGACQSLVWSQLNFVMLCLCRGALITIDQYKPPCTNANNHACASDTSTRPHTTQMQKRMRAKCQGCIFSPSHRWLAGFQVRPCGLHGHLFKKVIKEGSGWESLRPPCEVSP